ncbi:DUF2270 domain-containing protein [Hyphococcus lacteus]|uniref:DUF2270 domain-containing protein n=1 Tax=Hyphococcus lacteus TaxID=3143536 RepID=A0ABV3Z2S1_9PROT
MNNRLVREEWDQWQSPPGGTGNEFDSAEIGALAHLYRGEVYRSTIWRTRLDNTTNWSVVTLGIALSVTYASPNASPLPLLLVGILICMFLILESRRYRFFNVWRARCRWIETNFYAPMLFSSTRPKPGEWQDVLAQDYMTPQYHIGFWRAMGRRLRRNYMWIFSFQAVSYCGKIIIHPTPLSTFSEFVNRMAIGPFDGAMIFSFGVIFHGSWVLLALWTHIQDHKKHNPREGVGGMG